MKVVLKHAGKWLSFQNPQRVLLANRVDAVLPMLLEAEESGLYAAGFISYEAAPAFDPALKTHSPGGFPLLCLGLFDAPLILEKLEESPAGDFKVGDLRASVTKREFSKAISEIKEHIAAGASYQVNYTYRLNAAFSGNPWPFFCHLVKDQKAEYAAYVDTGEHTICSASPELFFDFKDGSIVSRPMKGTSRRGRTFEEDLQLGEDLRHSEKERAENIMIVDMIRNDIGRVARLGSVETTSRFDIEKYPTAWQMTSTVRGKSDADIAATLCALFPCASITGAPKVKTMEIIRNLETSPRKIYTGSIGFITPQGGACFNVAIRTALIEKGRLEFGVGGGIVWDSEVEAEYEETLTKAQVLSLYRPAFRLLETMLWEPRSGIFLMNEHLQRLGKSAAYFDMTLDIDAVLKCLVNLGDERLRVRLLVSRDGQIEVQTHPLKPEKGAVSTITAAIAKAPVDAEDIFLFHKTTHRDVYENAKAHFPEHGDVILWNKKGQVTEGCIGNVVIRKDGRLVTPPVDCGLLAGTFREHLLKNGDIEEGVFTVGELLNSNEVFLVNSVRRWQKVIIEQ